MAVTNLKRVQLGQEVTWGTSVVATAILMGVTDSGLDIKDDTHQCEEQGFLSPSLLTAQARQWAEASISYELTYEDIIYLLDGWFGDCTPGGAGPYEWFYVAPIATAVAPREYTVEYGMADAEYEMSGAIFNDGSISGDLDGSGVWEASVNLIGKKAEAGTMASLSSRSVELIRVADTVLTIDAIAGTMGATVVSNALISFELTVDPGYHLKHFNDLNPTSFGYDKWEGGLSVTAEFTSDVKAYIDAVSGAKIEKQIQLEATSGTSIATIGFAGILTDGVTLFDDRDGNATVAMEFVGTYNTTFGNWLKIDITNDVATLV